MRTRPVLVVHNYYQQPGGEDEVFAGEGTLLQERNHPVVRYTIHNDQVTQLSPARLATATLWNQDIYRDLRRLIRTERPLVAHFHNTFPLISPAAYYAAKAEGVPVVQTLHNYRLLCPVALFFRDGHVCQECLNRAMPWPGVVHSCYRGSRTASGGVAIMLTVHRALGTWTRKVDIYIALTEFAKQKFIEGGLPAEKIVVKPNFVHPDPGIGHGCGNYALFAGRLAGEKGVATLLAAWKRLGQRIPLKIVGDGPLAPQVVESAGQIPGVTWLGRKPATELYRLMGEATCVLFTSEWYETFGRVIIEAFAKGTPVIAANIGASGELVDHGRTGLHFRPGDPDDLADRVEWLIANTAERARMRQEARAEFEAKYTADRNYATLTDIYRRAAASLS